ncbi:MAG: glycosyltransferase family 4 protein [Candidatus Altiarchaeota archaeon]
MVLRHRHHAQSQAQSESFNIVVIAGRISEYGGGERYINKLNSLLLDDSASRIHVIYGTDERGAKSREEPVGKGVIVHHPLYVSEASQASSYVSRSLHYGRELARICGSEDVDLVHIHFSPFNPISLSSALLSRFNRVPVMLTHHRDVRSFGFSLKSLAMRPIAAATTRVANKCTGVSIAACDVFRGHGEVIGSFVDTEFFRPDNPGINAKEFAEAHSLGGKFVVAVPARFEEKKGQMHLLKALPLVKRESGGRCDPCVVLAGLHKDSGFVESLQDYTRAQNLEGNVRILDMLPPEGVRDMLAASNCFCLPSDTEALPLSIIEASAMAKPVIATRVGGSPEAVVEEGPGKKATGILVEPQNPAQLAHAILVLWQNPGLASQLGVNGRGFAVNDYSPDNFLRRVKGFYYELISGRR